MSAPFEYVATDIAPGLTHREWRRERRPAAVSPPLRRLARRLVLLMQRCCNICGRPSTGPRCDRHALRARPRGNAFEPTRRAVLERDGWRCQVVRDGFRCGRPATHVDHIVPLAAGGGDELSNLRAACATCNLARGQGGPFDHGRNPPPR